MKEENAEDGLRIERFFRPDPRVRQCRPETRNFMAEDQWSRAFGSQGCTGVQRAGQGGLCLSQACRAEARNPFFLTLEQCFRVAECTVAGQPLEKAFFFVGGGQATPMATRDPVRGPLRRGKWHSEKERFSSCSSERNSRGRGRILSDLLSESRSAIA